jgi:3-hexulose-6-phosphate synthase/6-phospho-3-hexuloisomerase
LIKSEGLESVRSLKRKFPGHTVVADLKTMDVGGLETEIRNI